jgi:hypothetical protein
VSGYTTHYAYVKLTTIQICQLIEAVSLLEATIEGVGSAENGQRGNLTRLRNKLQAAVPLPSQSTSSSTRRQ